jgi:hypothetical protein
MPIWYYFLTFAPHFKSQNSGNAIILIELTQLCIEHTPAESLELLI